MLSVPHSSHVAASGPDEVPARHGEQDDAPCSAYVPASHIVLVLVPSHDDPAGHASQLVRVVLLPPDEKKPPGHVLQLVAPASLYFLSLLHGVHTLAPAAA